MSGDPEGDSAKSSTTPSRRAIRALGLGLITGAADDDCSAIGTYAAAGAKLGPSFLWTAPVTFPMMFAVVYLSAKLGQVTGKGLFQAMRDAYPRWVIYPALVGVLLGNTFEAGADLGGMAAAVEIFAPGWFNFAVVGIACIILAVQIWGSYVLIRNVFRWLALSLLAYIAAAALAKPELWPVIRGTFVPHIQLNAEFLSLLVAVIGTTLSAYLYTWQSNEEVEEEIARGRVRLEDRAGTTDADLKQTGLDVLAGMFFSNLIMYFIILSTAATLFKAGHHEVTTAAEAARALRPLAGDAAGALFALGIIAVGFLAVPVMTTGAAYDLAQTLGWSQGLGLRFREARAFYLTIIGATVVAVGVNFIGLNPMRVLVWSGIVQGFSTPPLMLLIMLMTNRRDVMGKDTNGWAINLLGWLTTAATFAATIVLVVIWIG